MVLSLLLACSAGDDSASAPDPLLGSWAGTCEVPLEGGTLYLIIAVALDGEDEGGLSGTGTASGGSWDFSGEASLTRQDAAVEILLSDGEDQVRVAGEWDGADAIAGDCSIYQDEFGPVVLSR